MTYIYVVQSYICGTVIYTSYTIYTLYTSICCENFSKVSSIVIRCPKLSCKLTCENFCPFKEMETEARMEVKILKNQLATQFTIQYNHRADF